MEFKTVKEWDKPGSVRFRGERLELRFKSRNEKAIAAYLSWLEDEETAAYMEQNGVEATADSVFRELDKGITGGNGQYERVDYDIVVKDKIIGSCMFAKYHEQPTAFLKVVIGKAEDRGNGYATEALELLIRHGFEQLNLHSFVMPIPSYSGEAFLMADKLDFMNIGFLPETIWYAGEWFDTVYFQLRKEHYMEGTRDVYNS